MGLQPGAARGAPGVHPSWSARSHRLHDEADAGNRRRPVLPAVVADVLPLGGHAAEAYDFVALLGKVDIRRFLGAVRVPTLLLHRTADPWIDVHTSRYMAERIPDARLVELAGDEHLPFLGDQDSVVALTQEFLTGTRSPIPIGCWPRCCSPISWTPPGWRPSSATGAGIAPWSSTTWWCAPIWPDSAAGRSRPPVTGSWPPSTARPGRSGQPPPSGLSWPSTASRSGLACTPANASCWATTSAGHIAARVLARAGAGASVLADGQGPGRRGRLRVHRPWSAPAQRRAGPVAAVCNPAR